MARKKAIIGNCPGCGYGIGAGDYSCPQCGRAIFLDASKDPDVEIARIKAQESVTNTRINRAVDAAIEREREKTKRKDQGGDHKSIIWGLIVVLVVAIGVVLIIRWGIGNENKEKQEIEDTITKIETAIHDGNFDEAEKLLIKFKRMGTSTNDKEYVKEMHERLTKQLNEKKKDSSRIILSDPICIFAA